MITLLGVGHVFDLRRPIRDAILARHPRVVALELDASRYVALMQRAPRARGVSVLHLLASLESRIATQYGVQVGDEMVAAANAAQEIGAEVALIDRDSREVLLRAWRGMPFRERIRFLIGILRSAFVGRETVEHELQRYHADERAVIEEFATELPTAKRILIDERDAHMAERLRILHQAKGDVVAIVGDGHIGGLQERLEGEPVQVVRLRELRSAPPGSTATARVSYRL